MPPMTETGFQFEMLRAILKAAGWNFFQTSTGRWSAVRQNDHLRYEGELHDVVLRAATLHVGGSIR